jgi:hypothetical protein
MITESNGLLTVDSDPLKGSQIRAPHAEGELNCQQGRARPRRAARAPPPPRGRRCCRTAPRHGARSRRHCCDRSPYRGSSPPSVSGRAPPGRQGQSPPEPPTEPRAGICRHILASRSGPSGRQACRPEGPERKASIWRRRFAGLSVTQTNSQETDTGNLL